MTVKEIIEILKQQKYPYPEHYKDIEVNEALDLAIRALEEIDNAPTLDIQETDTVKELRQQLAGKEAELNEAVKVIAKLVCRQHKCEWICNPTYCYKCNQTNCGAKMDKKEADNDR